MVAKPLRQGVAHSLDALSQGFPIGHGAVGLVGLAGLADGVVEVGPLLGLVLGLEEVTDGAEAAGEALAAFRTDSSACGPAYRHSGAGRHAQAGGVLWVSVNVFQIDPILPGSNGVVPRIAGIKRRGGPVSLARIGSKRIRHFNPDSVGGPVEKNMVNGA